MYIGAVAVLPTYVVVPRPWGSISQKVIFGRLLQESKSGKQALREVRGWFMSRVLEELTGLYFLSLRRWHLAWRACSSWRKCRYFSRDSWSLR